MTKVVSPPFLRAARDVVGAEAWQAVAGGAPGPLQAVLPHWDSNSGLSLLRHVTIDVASLIDQCGLDGSATVRACVVWRSSGTALRGAGSNAALSAPERRQEAILKADIPGHLLGEDVHIYTQVVLASAAATQNPLAARLPGSVLWE